MTSWHEDPYADHEHPLDAARGVFVGLLGGLLLWCLIIGAIVLAVKYA